MPSLVRLMSSVLVLGVASVAVAQMPAPKLPPMNLLMPPPPANDGTVAYQFRTRLSSAPQCQRFASESDTVFLDDRTDTATKAALLKKIEAEAQSNNCLTPP